MLVSYGLILLSGIVIGALGMYFGGPGLRLQKRERGLLKQRQAQLDHDYSELDSYCSRMISGLEQMTNDCRLLRQQARFSTSLRPGAPGRLLYQRSGVDLAMEQEQSPMRAAPPCDYSGTASDLLRPNPESRQPSDPLAS